MEKIKGKVIKGVGGRYSVFSSGEKYSCFAQKKVKYFYDDVTVGDDVLFVKQGKDYVLTDILPRRNSLVRPAVSNVDGVFVVVAPLPQPDLNLVDKVIVNCNKQSVPVTIVVNKLDIVITQLTAHIRRPTNFIIYICAFYTKHFVERT